MATSVACHLSGGRFGLFGHALATRVAGPVACLRAEAVALGVAVEDREHRRAAFARALGRVVRAERQRRGIGQKTVARALGITQPAVSDIERGKTGRFPVRRIPALATVLGLTVAELLHRTEIEMKESGE